MTRHILELQKVGYSITSRKFFKVQKKNILTDINLQFEYRKIHGLIGSSGAGKTSLARIIAGIESNFTGTVLDHSVKKAMVFQDSHSIFNPLLSVEKILREMTILNREMIWSDVENIMQLCGLNLDFLKRSVAELSGGQRQRLNLARALLLKPDLLILDEPFSALDATIQSQMIDFILHLQQELSLTIVLIAHDLPTVLYLCDSITLLEKGKVVTSQETSAFLVSRSAKSAS